MAVFRQFASAELLTSRDVNRTGRHRNQPNSFANFGCQKSERRQSAAEHWKAIKPVAPPSHGAVHLVGAMSAVRSAALVTAEQKKTKPRTDPADTAGHPVVRY